MKSIDAKLFPSWEGLGVGSFPRFHEDKGREIFTPLESLEEASNPFHTVFSQTPPFQTETPF